MTDPIIFQGSYSDLKFVKTRSVAQVVVEIPIEQAQRFIKEFGAPIPGSEAPVAIARMVPGAKPLGDNDAVEAPVAPEKRKERTRSQMAAIRCGDAEWRLWHDLPSDCDAEGAAVWLRNFLGIQSRRELDTSLTKSAIWDEMDEQFKMATGRSAERTI